MGLLINQTLGESKARTGAETAELKMSNPRSMPLSFTWSWLPKYLLFLLLILRLHFLVSNLRPRPPPAHSSATPSSSPPPTSSGVQEQLICRTSVHRITA
ncbi:hypothetical protein BDW69DRAFT_164960 [Aspergillus filifer]